MIHISQVLDLLIPSKVKIANYKTIITEPLPLKSGNLREDVLMWVSLKHIETISSIKNGTIICPNVESLQLNKTCNYIFVENPRQAFSSVLTAFFMPKPGFTIAKTAMIDPSVKMGENIFIGENVVIEAHCQVGNNVKIGHNSVILANTIIKNNVIIGSNNVIGSVGFGYEKDEKGDYVFIPHIGNVIIEDFVEIGNCTTIDRAVMGSTILRKNVKVDNLVHIAHGVDIGENSLIIANAMIGGSTKIGKNVWVAPSSSLINKIEIEDNAVIGLGAVVVKSVKENTVVVGNPAKPFERK
jgi:UDP-3-O-[3-hydroxymyristoyl] glucosamine N-acyltransferase